MTEDTRIVMIKQKEPYFYVNELSFINSSKCCDHLEYVDQIFEDDDIMVYERRLTYTKKINRWLNMPLITDASRYYDTLEDDFNFSEIDGYNYAMFTKNKVLVEDIYNSIKSILKRSELQLSDENQFKEDFIYFMYKLSDISHT